MVVLENIKKIGNIIEADYYYEYTSDGSRGHFKYGITTGNFIEIKRAEEDEFGFGHIKQGLETMIKYNTFPETYKVFWY